MSEDILDDAPEYRRNLNPEQVQYKKELHGELDFAQRQISRARLVLYLLIVFQLLGLIVAVSAGMYSSVEIAIQVALVVVFIVSAYLSVEYPFLAFAGSLTLYLLLVFLASLVNPFFLLRGILWKLVVVLFLAVGIYYSFERKRLVRELEGL